MIIGFLKIAIGILLLYFGATAVVNSSIRIARRFGLSELWIGLTVVAFGTSLPELVVGLLSTYRKSSDLILSNVAGANIANITLILGITGLITPLYIKEKSTRRQILFMILAGAVFYLLAIKDNSMSLLDGIVLLLLFTIFTFSVCVKDFFREPPMCRKEQAKEQENSEPITTPLILDIVLAVFGIAGLGFGADLTVSAALFVANALNISQTVVGGTVVALGTTLPELFTSVVAAMKGKIDISLGNIIGSCVFNMLAIVGFSTFINPLWVNPSLIHLDFPVMLATSIIVIPMVSPDFHIDKWESTILIICYVFYVITKVFG